MLLRRTVPVLALAAGLFGFIWFVERRGPTTEEARSRAGRLVDLDAESVTRIESTGGTAGGESWILAKGERGWRLDAPVKTAVDVGLAGGVVADLSRVEIESRLPEPVDRKAYGLDPPQRVVTVLSPSGSATIRVGHEVPGFEAVAVEVEGREGSFAVRRGTGVAASRRVDELRTKEIFSELLRDLLRVSVRPPGSAAPWSLEKRDGEWWVVEPGRPDDLGDVKAIDRFLDALAGSKVESFGSTPPDPASSWEIVLSSRGEETRVVLEPPGAITGPPDGRCRVLLGSESLQLLASFPKDLPFEPRSRIATAGRGFQASKVVLTKGAETRTFESIDAGSSWATTGGTVAPERVGRLLDHLRSAVGEGRLSPADAPRAGFRSMIPAFVVEVTEGGSGASHRFEFIRADGGGWGIWYRRRPDLVFFGERPFAPILADLEALAAAVPTPDPLPPASATAPPR